MRLLSRDMPEATGLPADPPFQELGGCVISQFGSPSQLFYWIVRTLPQL